MLLAHKKYTPSRSYMKKKQLYTIIEAKVAKIAYHCDWWINLVTSRTEVKVLTTAVRGLSEGRCGNHPGAPKLESRERLSCAHSYKGEEEDTWGKLKIRKLGEKRTREDRIILYLKIHHK